jgi:hypothetical protein
LYALENFIKAKRILRIPSVIILQRAAEYFIPRGKKLLVQKLLMSVDSSNLD